MRISRLLFSLAILTEIPIGSALAQPANRTIVNQGIVWGSYTANLKLTDRITLFLDAHFRTAQSQESGRFLDMMQIMPRTHLEIKLKGKLTIAPLGFAYVENFKYGKQPASTINNEHRLYQQVAYSHNWGKTSIGHRLRIEERYIQEHDANGESLGFTNHQVRARYRFMATRPIGKEKIEPKTYFTQAFYEGFISRGKKVTFEDIDQNRLFVGLGYQPIKGLNLSIGPFYQMLVKANGAKQENNLGLMFMAVHNIDLTAKNQ